MLAPFAILFGMFTVLPVARSIILSFTSFNVLQPPKFIGLENYINLFSTDKVFFIALKNTILFAIITGTLSFAMCLLLAWLINDLGRNMRRVLTLVFYAPSISGAVATVWGVFFSSDRYGYINSILVQTGLTDTAIKWFKDPQYILATMIVIQLWTSLGTSFLAFIAGLQGVDRSLYEAGAVDGLKNRWQELWFITLPSMRPQLMFAAVIQIAAAFTVSDIGAVFTGFPSVDYAGHTISMHILDYGMLRFEFGYASAIATVLFVIIAVFNTSIQSFIRKVGE